MSAQKSLEIEPSLFVRKMSALAQPPLSPPLPLVCADQRCGSSRIFFASASSPDPHIVGRFQVYFLFQLLSLTCFRFHKNLTASSFRFHIPALCFMKNASASGSSKSSDVRTFFEQKGAENVKYRFCFAKKNRQSTASISDFNGSSRALHIL